MPELPEVETMRRGILGAEGARVEQAKKCRCQKRPLQMNVPWSTIARRLRNQVLNKVDRRGKRLILRFANNWSLVIEPRMTGLVLVENPPTKEHLRFEFHLSGADCDRIAFWDQRGLGQVFLLDADGLTEYLSPKRIGPDAMEITVQQLRENLSKRSIAIKVGLLDQKAIAGVGNIYASEILHLAKIDPRKRCNEISKPQWKTIHKQTLVVLQTAIDAEGSTLSDGTYRTALNDPGSYQNEHRVYDRGEETCLSCKGHPKGKIQRIVQAQRSTYYCRKCQKRQAHFL